MLLIAVLMIAYFVIRKMNTKQSPQTTTAAETDANGAAVLTTALPALSGRAQLLFVCMDSGQASIALIGDFDLDQGLVSVYALPTDTRYPSDGGDALPGDIYRSAGREALTDAVNRRCGTAIARTVVCTADNFADMTALLGEAEITVPYAVSYADAGAVIELQAGKHSLSGAALYNYLLHGATGEALYDLQAATAAQMLRAYISPANVGAGESLFSKLVNAADSDITAYDYAAYADLLAVMAADTALTYTGAGLAAARSEG